MITIQIHNDGTGTDHSANYDYSVYVNHREVEQGHVEGHNRADGWWKLARLVVADAAQRREIKP